MLEAWSSPFLTVLCPPHFKDPALITRVQNVLTTGITLEMDVLFSRKGTDEVLKGD